MLPNTLNTNEVKNAAGSEVEFERFSTAERALEFSKIGEAPNAPNHLRVSHLSVGSGADERRRSMVRVDLEVVGVSGSPRVHSAYLVCDIPVGDIADYTDAKTALAELMSFVASLGASTTILYDCTGNGAASLINGTL